jgi:hypothetical protein
MTTQRTLHTTWPMDERKLLPEKHQRAAWLALADSRDLLSDIAKSAKLLSITAFAGQEASRRLSIALNTALIELEVALGCSGVMEFETPPEPVNPRAGGCASA